jgi:ABC-type sulfate transport system permease subunit
VIKLILAGLWACLITLAASYAAVSWHANHASPEPEPERLAGVTETVRTRMISVPVIRSGLVQGYVVAQFSFTAEAATLKRLPLKADVVVLDEAFRAIYSEDGFDFRNMKKQDLGALMKRIVEGSNQRFGTHVVQDAFIQEFSYVTKDGVRSGTKQGT